mmetsp:Transcript_8757/g.17365  ORF Transcript_8757/g.17365 Transcript_8757/m.17365 type:complete len:203 (+) Transcript_8757:880-1488(+)
MGPWCPHIASPTMRKRKSKARHPLRNCSSTLQFWHCPMSPPMRATVSCVPGRKRSATLVESEMLAIQAPRLPGLELKDGLLCPKARAIPPSACSNFFPARFSWSLLAFERSSIWPKVAASATEHAPAAMPWPAPCMTGATVFVAKPPTSQPTRVASFAVREAARSIALFECLLSPSWAPAMTPRPAVSRAPPMAPQKAMTRN